MFVGFTRVMAVVMAGVICFGLLVPLAVRKHDVALALVIAGVYAVYLVVNVVVWRRLRRT